MALSTSLTRRALIRWLGILVAGTASASLTGCCGPACGVVPGLLRRPTSTSTPTCTLTPTRTLTPTSRPTATRVPATATRQAATATRPAATSTKTLPTKAPVLSGKVTVMCYESDMTEAHWNEFAEQLSDVAAFNISVQYADPATYRSRLAAALAAGDAPDVFHLDASNFHELLLLKAPLKLQPLVDTKAFISPDDLTPGNNQFRWDGSRAGKGDLYGLCGSWSPDFTIFCNKKHFEELGIALPSEQKPLTYVELAGLARRLGKKGSDGRATRWGLGYTESWLERMMMNMLAETGKGLYAGDLTKMSLADSPEAVRIARYWFDLAKDDLTSNPLHPSTNWIGADFAKGQVAMLQAGYWFNTSAEGTATKGAVTMIPAPTWSGVRRDPPMYASGMAIWSGSKEPIPAWVVLYYYASGQPAKDRATGGLTVPTLKSLYKHMPAQTPFQQQMLRVVQGELPYAGDALPFNPYIASDAVAKSLKQYLGEALSGRITFDNMLKKVQDETNAAILAGMRRFN